MKLSVMDTCRANSCGAIHGWGEETERSQDTRSSPAREVCLPSLDFVVITFIFLCSCSSRDSSYLLCRQRALGCCVTRERMGQSRRTSPTIPRPPRAMELGSSEGRGTEWIPCPQRGMSTQGGARLAAPAWVLRAQSSWLRLGLLYANGNLWETFRGAGFQGAIHCSRGASQLPREGSRKH